MPREAVSLVHFQRQFSCLGVRQLHSRLIDKRLRGFGRHLTQRRDHQARLDGDENVWQLVSSGKAIDQSTVLFQQRQTTSQVWVAIDGNGQWQLAALLQRSELLFSTEYSLKSLNWREPRTRMPPERGVFFSSDKAHDSWQC